MGQFGPVCEEYYGLECLVYHLLVNQELYQERNCQKSGEKPVEKDPASSYMPEDQLEDKVAAIVDAFYHLKAQGAVLVNYLN